MNDCIWFYITTGDLDEAKRIARRALEHHLIACANIIEPMHSMYWWEGEIQEDFECLLVGKTTTDAFDDLVDLVSSAHDYDCPCVIALPIVDGHPDFLEWIRDETLRDQDDV